MSVYVKACGCQVAGDFTAFWNGYVLSVKRGSDERFVTSDLPSNTHADPPICASCDTAMMLVSVVRETSELVWDAREGAYRIGQTARLIALVVGEVTGPFDPDEPLRWAVSKTGGELTQDERRAIAAFMAERWRLWGEQEPMQVLAPVSRIIRPN